MAHEQLEGLFCNLPFFLFGNRSTITTYNAKGGMRRTITLTGRIKNPDYGGPFNQKTVRLTITSPPDEGRLEKICSLVEVDETCGFVRIYEGVEPEQFEPFNTSDMYDDELIPEGDPVEVELEVSDPAFKAIQFEITEAASSTVLRMDVALTGRCLPVPRSDYVNLYLCDLDVTELLGYGVGNFDLTASLFVDKNQTE